MSSGYRVRITPADVGRRVSLRLRLHGNAGGQAMTDVVGRLLTWEGESLCVKRRDGSVAEVAVADLLAAKTLDELAPRRRRPEKDADGDADGDADRGPRHHRPPEGNTYH